MTAITFPFATFIGRVITDWGAIQKRSHELMYKTKTRNKAKRLRLNRLDPFPLSIK